MYELKRASNGTKSSILTVAEASTITNNIALLGKYMHTYFFYQIVKRNLNQLLDFIDSTQNTLNKIDILECNRLLFNFADTFYGYINFFESNYKAAFETIKKDLFDNNFEYAFIYKLRNYIIHEDLPIFKLSKEVGEDYIKSKFIILKEKLLSSNRIGATMKMRIEKQFSNSNDIDIYPILIALKKIIVKLQIKMISALHETLLSAFVGLRNYIVNDEEVYLFKDGKLVNGLLNVLNKYYKCMADNFVYDDELLSDDKVYKLYMDFSYSYYGKRGVVYQPNCQ